MASELAVEEKEELQEVRIGSYGGLVRLVEDSTEETMLLWGIQQPTFSKQNSFVRQSSISLHLDACGHSFSIIQSPSSLSAPGVTGAVMWDSGIVLGKFLEHAVDSGMLFLQGKKVVELGSGCGFVGCIAALLGAQVILTDLPDRLRLLKKNIEANLRHGNLRGSATVNELIWGDDPEPEMIDPLPDYVVFPPCPCPPHKELLDALLTDSEVDRSVSTLLNFNQIYSRVRQVSEPSDQSRVRATTFRDITEEDSSHSGSDSCSEYDPCAEMSGKNANMIEERRKKANLDREAQMLAMRSKVRKTAGSGSDKGKGVSSVTADMVVQGLAAPPMATGGHVKGKVTRSPGSYDVEKLARWRPPTDIDEASRAKLEKLPRLPTPRGCSNFGVLGTGPVYARQVIAPYMSFAGDKEKLKARSSSEIFNSMLESTTETLAMLSFSAQATAEREAALEKGVMESEHRVMEGKREMQELVRGFDSEREELVDAAVQQYMQGQEKGELSGWDEAVRAFVELGHITQAVADGVICPFPLSHDDGERDDFMDTEGAQNEVNHGAGGGAVTGEETA